MVREVVIRPKSGWGMLGVIVVAILVVGPGLLIAGGAGVAAPWSVIGGLLVIGAGGIAAIGFMAVAPNDARVLLLFGEYRGSVKDSGFFWVNPFYSKRRISLRIRNFETGGGGGEAGPERAVARPSPGLTRRSIR